MIIEHFGTSEKVLYNEDTGIFTIKHNIISWFDTNINEKDIHIIKINELREIAESTTLTQYDIDMLFNFAKSKFNFKDTKDKFIYAPLKNIFPNSNFSTIGQLMILAYDKK